jgi:hypothetical protein
VLVGGITHPKISHPSGRGFRSNWHRLIQTGLKGRKKSNGEVALEPVIKESFTFHDLRAK